MSFFSRSFAHLKPLPLLGGLAALFAVSCASRPSPEPLPKGFREFATKFRQESPLCRLPANHFSAFVKDGARGPYTTAPLKLLPLLERINWNKERSLRTEATRYLTLMPEHVTEADAIFVAKLQSCAYLDLHKAVQALVASETANRHALSKRAASVVAHYVDAGPSVTNIDLMLKWKILRELSIADAYLSRLNKNLESEMDAFNVEIKEGVGGIVELQAKYERILAKLRPIFFSSNGNDEFFR